MEPLSFLGVSCGLHLLLRWALDGKCWNVLNTPPDGMTVGSQLTRGCERLRCCGQRARRPRAVGVVINKLNFLLHEHLYFPYIGRGSRPKSITGMPRVSAEYFGIFHNYSPQFTGSLE